MQLVNQNTQQSILGCFIYKKHRGHFKLTQNTISSILGKIRKLTFFLRGGGGGGYQAYFFGNIHFEIEVAKQGPYMYQHFGEVLGPRRPTGSEPRPALIWAPNFNLILSIQFTNIIESNMYYKKYLGTVRRWLGIQLKSVSLQH